MTAKALLTLALGATLGAGVPAAPIASTGVPQAARRDASRNAADGLLIVVPAAPGGGWDQLARTVKGVLEREGLASRVQVQNIPGAAGTIGLARLTTTYRADPNVILITGLVMVGGIAQHRSQVTLDSTTPLARLVGEYEVIVVPARSPYATLGGLLDAFRQRPGAISWGGGSAGGTDHILVDLLAGHAGVDPRRTNYVAFSGGGEALTALLGEQVTAGVGGYGEFEQHITEGRLRALAISAPARVTALDVPTLREAGVPLELSNWRGIVAPPDARPARRRELIAVFDEMRRTRAWQDELTRRAWTDLWLDGDAFARFLSAESRRVEALADARRAATGAEPASGPLQPAGRSRGGRAYERLTIALLGLSMAAWLANTLRARRSRVGREPRAVLVGGGRRVALVAGAMALNLALLEVAGFVAAATVLAWLVARAFGARDARVAGVAALLFALATYGLFQHVLGVRLPGGVWSVFL